MHDTIRAVLRDPAYYRSVRSSLGDRALIWLLDAFDRVGKALKHLPSGRNIGLGVVVLLVLFLVARVFIAARRSDESLAFAPSRRNATTSDDPWRLADQHAAAGRYEEAVHALYRGVLLSLGRDERLRLHPSNTSGDYARELRRRNSSSLTPFRTFTRRFDVIVYGHGGANAGAFAELAALSAPFRARSMAA